IWISMGRSRLSATASTRRTMDTSPRLGAVFSTADTARATRRLADMTSPFRHRCPGAFRSAQEAGYSLRPDHVTGPSLSIPDKAPAKREEHTPRGARPRAGGDRSHPGVAQLFAVAGPEGHRFA